MIRRQQASAALFALLLSACREPGVETATSSSTSSGSSTTTASSTVGSTGSGSASSSSGSSSSASSSGSSASSAASSGSSSASGTGTSTGTSSSGSTGGCLAPALRPAACQQLAIPALPDAVETLLIAADLDGDCRPDLLRSTRLGSTPGLSWLPQLPGGGFGTARPLGAPATRLAARGGTFAFEADAVTQLLTSQAGPVAQRTALPLPPRGVPAAADIDGDAREELLFALTTVDGGVQLALAPIDRAGPLTTGASLPRGVNALAALDVDGDGLRDLAIGGETGLGYLLGDGRGGLFVSLPSDVGETVRDLLVRDVDGDGREDLLVLGESALHLLLRQPSGGFLGQRERPLAGGGLQSMALVDLLGSGRVELAIAQQLAGAPDALLRFLDPLTLDRSRPPTRFEGRLSGISAVDVDRDGRDDLVLQGFGTATVRASHGPSGISGEPTFPFALAGTPELVDLEGTGALELLALHTPGDGGAPVLLGRAASGPHGLEEERLALLPGTPMALLAPGRGALALVDFGGQLRTLRDPADGGLVAVEPTGPRVAEPTTSAMQALDVDGDGLRDLLALDGLGLTLLRVWEDGGLDSPQRLDALRGTELPLAADVDGDGRLDLVGLQGLALQLIDGGLTGHDAPLAGAPLCLSPSTAGAVLVATDAGVATQQLQGDGGWSSSVVTVPGLAATSAVVVAGELLTTSTLPGFGVEVGRWQGRVDGGWGRIDVARFASPGRLTVAPWGADGGRIGVLLQPGRVLLPFGDPCR